jgi:hypothetical protein
MYALGEPIQCRVGDEVIGSDDHKIGKVVAFDSDFLTVEHGLLKKSDYYIPMSAVNACNDGKVYLNVSKDEIATQGWDVPPAMDTEAGGRPVVG